MNWYYVQKGEKIGPVPEEEVRGLIEARALDAQTLVWHEGAPDWSALASFPEWASLLPAKRESHPQALTAAGAQPVLTLKELRDPSEKTALTWLYVLSVPAWCVLLLFFSVALPLVGLVLLARYMGEYFAAAYIKTNGIRVSERQLPELHEAVVRCSEKLGISPPDLYVMQHSVWNAFASKLASQRVVVLYSGAVDSVLLKGDHQQLTWIVAHEIGHHAAGHLDFVRKLARVGAWAPWIALWYSRRCEFTCDRIALYCVGKLQPSLLTLANCAVGAQFAGQVSIPAALADWKNYRDEFFVKYRTIYSTHPPHLWRMQQLCDAAMEFGIS